MKLGVRAAVGVLVLGLLGFGRAGAESPLPGPAPQHRSTSPAALNQDCEDCHQTIAREWRSSYHQKAYRDAAFQRALRREPTPFCRRCHAAEADPQVPASGWAADSGVACVTCHVLGGQLVTGVSNRSRPVTTEHAVTRRPELSAPAACARCHQFQFPDATARRRPEFMQLTLSEHEAAPQAEVSCIDCHMPRQADGHRSHRFLGGHDAATLRQAVAVQAQRRGDGVALVIVPRGVGHAFPTGDLFRRLVVRVDVQAAPGVAAQRRDLMRHFTSERQLGATPVRVCQTDDRLTGAAWLDFPLGATAAGHAVRWSVAYQRVDFPLDLRGGPAVLDAEIVLYQGELAPLGPSAEARAD